MFSPAVPATTRFEGGAGMIPTCLLMAGAMTTSPKPPLASRYARFLAGHHSSRRPRGRATNQLRLTVTANGNRLVHESGQIELLRGGPGSDELSAPDVSNLWTITSANAGNLNGALDLSPSKI